MSQCKLELLKVSAKSNFAFASNDEKCTSKSNTWDMPNLERASFAYLISW